jgi:pimeloyl-ACP methyl ester carboxylesterase
MPHPIVHVNELDLRVEVRGAGRAILGIHGTPSSLALWRDAAGVLAQRGRAIIYDRRGYGGSVAPAPFASTDLSDHVDDAAGLLAALGVAPAVVIGRSTGGQIALALAHRHPASVRALVLLEPALFTADPAADAWARWLRETVLAEAEDHPARASELMIRRALGDSVWESLPDDVRRMLDAGAPAVLAEMRGIGLDLSADPLRLSDEELSSIRVPTLLVSAQDSPEPLRLVNQRLERAMPDARHVVVSGGHLIHPAHSVVLDFLSELG